VTHRGHLGASVLAVSGGLAIAVHVGLAVAVHVGLAAAVLTAWRWTSWGADLVLVFVVVKVAAIALGHLAIRRRKAGGTHRSQ
jgi:hypothetical protein